ncbi:MAG: PepSY domain-containing protein [Acidobacteriota bacterium]|nr:PepSY domain-containing protein [Acidobacteriota bacterium]
MKQKFLLAVLMSALLTGAGLVVAKPALFAGQKQNQKQKAEKEEREEAGQEENDEEESAAEQAKLTSQARITKDQAQEIALKRAPGTVESGELEREHGKLVYSFDIRNAQGTIDEVQVSAINGKIVRVEHETKAQEEAEKNKEAKEKKH